MEKLRSEIATAGLTTHRVEALTDCIFAFAMTLLVVNLGLPLLGEGLASRDLNARLWGQANQFLNYAISFSLLASFWMKHHQHFHFTKRTDRTHLWITVTLLMFIALIPFSTSLNDDYNDDSIAGLFFGVNMFLIGMLFFWSWSYATKGNRLVEHNLDPRLIILVKRRTLVVPAVAVMAMALTLIVPGWASLIYILIPILYGGLDFRHKRGQGGSLHAGEKRTSPPSDKNSADR